MGDRPLDLPDPEDAFDEDLIANVHEHGWAWIHVADEHHPHHPRDAEAEADPVADASFGYTLGVSLTLAHPEIILGYHLNKRPWNTVALDGGLPDAMVRDMIEDSYDLVVAKLPGAARRALGESGARRAPAPPP